MWRYLYLKVIPDLIAFIIRSNFIDEYLPEFLIEYLEEGRQENLNLFLPVEDDFQVPFALLNDLN